MTGGKKKKTWRTKICININQRTQELYCEKYHIYFFPQQNIPRVASHSFPHFSNSNFSQLTPNFVDFHWFSALLVTSHFLLRPLIPPMFIHLSSTSYFMPYFPFRLCIFFSQVHGRHRVHKHVHVCWTHTHTLTPPHTKGCTHTSAHTKVLT